MMDPPRPKVKKSIETCENAGITTVMITGDHKETAIAVAKELSLLKNDSVILTGAELEQMNDNRLKDAIDPMATGFYWILPVQYISRCTAIAPFVSSTGWMSCLNAPRLLIILQRIRIIESFLQIDSLVVLW